MNPPTALFASFVIAAFRFGCSGTVRTPQIPSITSERAPVPIATDQAAIDAASALLRNHHADWGPAIRVLHTGSGWYRVEFARANGQAERVVLVNPANGEASFPMPR